MLKSIVDNETQLHQSSSSLVNIYIPPPPLLVHHTSTSTMQDDSTILTGVTACIYLAIPCPLDCLVRAASDFSRDDF
jgi:hypothetical protein